MRTVSSRSSTVALLASLLAVVLPASTAAPIRAQDSPSSLDARGGDRVVNLSWNAPSGQNRNERLVGYRLYRDTDDDPEDATPVEIDDAEAETYTDEDVRNATKYWYALAALYREEGDVEESDFSNVVSATPQADAQDVSARFEDFDLPLPADEATTISVEATPPPRVERVTISYRRGGAEAFTSQTASCNGPTCTVEVPDAFVTARGVEVRARVEGKSGEVIALPDDGRPFASLTVRTEDDFVHQQPGGSEQSAYQLFSFPLRLDATSMFALVQDDLGPYAPADWRLFDIGPSGLADGDYRELDAPGASLQPGDAFWLISREEPRVRSGPGVSLRTDRVFSKALNDGWTLVGQPFAFPLPCTALSGVSEVMTYQSGGFVDVCESGGSLRPMAGYLAFPASGNAGGTLQIDPTVRGDAATARRSPPEDWAVQVEARSGTAHDRYNHAGVASTARRGLDPNDRREPPPVGAFVSVSFLPDREAARLRRDVRSSAAKEHSWVLEVRSTTGAPVTLRLTPRRVPAGTRLHLIDEASGRVYDAGAGGLRVRLPAAEGPRHLTLTAGADAERPFAGRAPTRVLLSPNAPNPVRRETTLRYGLPEAAVVHLAVYDLLGRRVALLADGERGAGFHTLRWSGRTDAGVPLASGSYFYRLRTGSTVRTRSLVVVR